MMRLARRGERGYALLVVLFFGAVMAIMLAVSLPRAAFESQRAKEDDLVYRGSQYSRAVRLYFRKNRKYPARLEDLEKTNNIRFLRRKYVDPITKKEEWRFIHIGPAGMFTDSLVYDKPQKKKEGEAAAAGSEPGAMGMADRLRASAGAGAVPGQVGDPNAYPPGVMPAGGAYGTVPGAPYGPGQTYFNVGQPGAGQTQAGVYPTGGYPAGVPGSPYPGAYPGMGQPVPGLPAGIAPPGTITPTQITPVQPGAFPGVTYPTAFPPGAFPGARPGFPGGPATGAAGIGSPAIGSEAARIIGQLLTTPRPGGLAGIQPGLGTTGAGGQGATFGGGIAGVASKSEARGIKVFNERENYNEWEFVYDYRRDPMLMGAMGMGAGVPGTGHPGTHQPGQPTVGQQGFGQPGFGQPFTQPGFGQPGFGQPGFGQPGFGQPGQGTVTPINPAQPGLPNSPFGPARPPPPPPPPPPH